MTQPVKRQEISDTYETRCIDRHPLDGLKLLSSLVASALCAPIPVSLISLYLDGGLFAAPIIYIGGVIVGLPCAFIIGLPVIGYAEKNNLREYSFYCMAGILSGIFLSVLLLLWLLLMDNSFKNIEAAVIFFIILVPSSWACASAFWYLRVRPEVAK